MEGAILASRSLLCRSHKPSSMTLISESESVLHGVPVSFTFSLSAHHVVESRVPCQEAMSASSLPSCRVSRVDETTWRMNEG